MNLREQVERLISNLLALGPRRLALLAAIGAAVFGLVGAAGYFLSRPTNEILYSGLDKQDVTRIGAALKDAGVAFDVSADGAAVYVGYGNTARARMLPAEQCRQALWRGRLRGKGLKIGLCWRGNVDFRVDTRRSIPPEALAPLAGLEGVRLFTLQKGGRTGELPPELARKLENLGEEPDSGRDPFVDTAALMMELDLIVTCDTSIVHLAGALGRPVWVALRHIAEWRWLDGCPDSPWYPTMRLCRAERGDDWGELFTQIADEIRKA
jgi:hypothetical protein